MKSFLTLAVFCALGACSCYPLRWARFVDGTEAERPAAWLCVPDDDTTNPTGIQCAHVRNFQLRGATAIEPPDAGTASM